MIANKFLLPLSDFKLILSQDSTHGVKSSCQCVQQKLKLRQRGFMPL